jgi:hypothetical protein
MYRAVLLVLMTLTAACAAPTETPSPTATPELTRTPIPDTATPDREATTTAESEVTRQAVVARSATEAAVIATTRAASGGVNPPPFDDWVFCHTFIEDMKAAGIEGGDDQAIAVVLEHSRERCCGPVSYYGGEVEQVMVEMICDRGMAAVSLLVSDRQMEFCRDLTLAVVDDGKASTELEAIEWVLKDQPDPCCWVFDWSEDPGVRALLEEHCDL